MTTEELNPILRQARAGQLANMSGNSDSEEPRTAQKYIISFMCILFGIGTWLPSNAVYTQMPIFTQYLPEGWSLPSHLSLLTQIANVAPFLYYCFQKRLAPYQSSFICFFLILGAISCLALAFTYDITALLFGQMHSVCFYIFAFGGALVGCISAVLFLPHMNKLPEIYLVPFFIGEGLSGLLPSAMSVIQGVGNEVCHKGKLVYEEPLFASSLFLVMIGCIMLLSTAAFIVLNYYFGSVMKAEELAESKNKKRESSDQLDMPVWLITGLLVLMAVISSFANGILPSVQSYSCLPYGTSAYHWSVLINQITSPVIMYLAIFLPVASLPLLWICSAIQGLCWMYELLTAFMSPKPPMVGTDEGAVTIVIVWMVGSCMTSYAKLSIASIFRRRYQHGLISYGLITQIGAAVGAVLSFVMINYFNVLHSLPKKPCS